MLHEEVHHTYTALIGHELDMGRAYAPMHVWILTYLELATYDIFPSPPHSVHLAPPTL